MKKSDIRAGLVIRHKHPEEYDRLLKFVSFEKSDSGLILVSQSSPESQYDVFQGYYHETNSHKGFTILSVIVNREVGAFFLFKDFEIIDHPASHLTSHISNLSQ